MPKSNQSSQATKRKDFELNQHKISQAILTHYKTHLKTPTHAEIAKLTGLSEKTVTRHFADMDFSQMYADARGKLAVHADVITMAILNSAIKGSGFAQKMAMQIVYNWSEPKFFDDGEIDETTVTPEELAMLDKGIQMMAKLKQVRTAQAKKQAKLISETVADVKPVEAADVAGDTTESPATEETAS